jgi:hypothetical protein
MAGKAPKAWALPRFWYTTRFYKKQPVKQIWGRILGLAWLQICRGARGLMQDGKSAQTPDQTS